MKKYLIVLALFCSVILIFCGNVAADQSVMPSNNNTALQVVNDNGARLNDSNNNSYTFFTGSGNGLGAVKITNDTSQTERVIFNNSQSGVFYIAYTGGKNYVDNGILMLAVNGTIPDNFQVNIKASGYQWTPVGGLPVYSSVTYNASALNEIFYKSDFIYGPQTWKPYYTPNFAIFEGQDMTDTSTFSIMLIDLYAGMLKHNAYSGSGITLIDNGSIKIEYSFQNLPVGSLAAFNTYGFSATSANQPAGVGWTNAVNPLGGSITKTSGYYVNGTAPIADFSATPTKGNVPLTVQFTDHSTGSDLSYVWEFGDGETSTLKDPAHTYNNPGKYTVKLTVTNASGSNKIVKTDYITINHAPVLNSIGNKAVSENKKLQFTVSGSDSDSDTLTYSASNLPLGASFNSATGTFTWTPNYNQAGKYQITFTVSDGSLTSSETINITVNNVDITKPTVISTYPKSGATKFSRTATIAIKFNENIKTSINWSKIYMKNLTTGKLVSISKWISGNTLYIKMPLKRYAFNWYKIYIPTSAVKDYSGNNAAGYTLSFKTGRY